MPSDFFPFCAVIGPAGWLRRAAQVRFAANWVEAMLMSESRTLSTVSALQIASVARRKSFILLGGMLTAGPCAMSGFLVMGFLGSGAEVSAASTAYVVLVSVSSSLTASADSPGVSRFISMV